jgi:hypothetical protein
VNFAACPYTLTASLSYIILKLMLACSSKVLVHGKSAKHTVSYVSKDDTLRQNSVGTVKVYVTSFSLSFCVAGNVLVKVECKAWARNIRHDRRDRIGLTHFQLLID